MSSLPGVGFSLVRLSLVGVGLGSGSVGSFSGPPAHIGKGVMVKERLGWQFLYSIEPWCYSASVWAWHWLALPRQLPPLLIAHCLEFCDCSGEPSASVSFRLAVAHCSFPFFPFLLLLPVLLTLVLAVLQQRLPCVSGPCQIMVA